ncbi:hypothetical protein [Streptomyces fuscichromogenes]|uniref:Uncharacterized protein n=1 Tax=Streptomyces fuscichromogenes TaxID=1324013 RepID=A0A918CWF1_9ACTN|nr:hypothetical protein [Streptomyces fuscichromogenes]GGN39483.1 hypothetical protein GCM10011578_086090 [Streptomyces fuscichromogenes]
MRDYRDGQLDGKGAEAEPGAPVTAQTVEEGSCGETVMAIGLTPRARDAPGRDRPSVVSCPVVLRDWLSAGERVALMGAGGIGLHAGVRRGACQGRVRNRGRPGPARNLIREVSDASDTRPQRCRARVQQEGGRSLTPVAQLRESWATGTPGTARTSRAEISPAMRRLGLIRFLRADGSAGRDEGPGRVKPRTKSLDFLISSACLPLGTALSQGRS